MLIGRVVSLPTRYFRKGQLLVFTDEVSEADVFSAVLKVAFHFCSAEGQEAQDLKPSHLPPFNCVSSRVAILGVDDGWWQIV
jgi:hypothetical protein